ncbi:unnamed protein product [Rotaria sordida]|uniref:NAD(P)(+)--arginine ADP-ribosyltransferase n=1 Tax=Rotaria sordida TaxID=392033 RepID=A0A814XPA9_9BILA|nr:unnamed protein product [Rotaria sordida]CAF4100561.1 unnamed protein product [Rotaria sordida]
MGIASYRRLKSRSSEDKNSLSSSSTEQEQSNESLPNGIILVWLDSPPYKSFSNNEKNILYYLRQLNVASIRVYNDVNLCLDFLKSISSVENIQSSKIFLILSDEFNLEILPELKSLSIVNSIFIFSMDSTKYVELIKEYESFIINICTNIDDLYNSINKQIEEHDELKLVFHFFAQKQNTTRDLTNDSASFLWFQLFQIIINDLKCTENDMNTMLNYCSKQLQKDRNPTKSLLEIEEFRQTYTSNDAIHWYTKESFVYRLLNRSLRTEDIEALYIFRFFIADLCRQLKIEYEKLRRKQNQSPILTVYRGAQISREELDDLFRTIGNLTSLNGFVSTSINQSVAIEFLRKKSSRTENLEKILFIIEIDIQSDYIICAYIKELSALQDEEEVLFNIGTVFYLDKILLDSNEKIWNVYMKATEAGISAVHDYIELIHQELTDTNISIIFGQLFLQMGKYILAQKYFLDLLEHSKENDPDLPRIHYHLALTYAYQYDLIQAENLLKQVYQFYRINNTNNLDLARIENALGWIHHHNGELDEAIIHYQTALNLAPDQLDLNHLINAQTCSLLGDCYLEKNQLDKAELFNKKTLEIERLRLPTDHPRIGVTLNDIGDVFRKRKQMNIALDYYQQAESIFHRSLPKYHPYIAYCWSCMAFVYLYDEKIEQAQEYHEKALQIYRHVLPSDHINIKISEKNSQCTDFQKINDAYVKVCSQV